MQTLLRITALAAVAVAVFGAVGLAWLPAQTQAGGTPAVALHAPASQPEPGETFPVTVVAANLPPLGAYEVVVTFDDRLLEFAYGADEGFLGSTGRNTSCFPPILATGEARFGCATTGSGSGPSGDGKLATLYFNALAPGDAEIALRDAGLADEYGNNAGSADLRGVMVTVKGERPLPTSTQPANHPDPEATWEATPQFVPPVDTPTTASGAGPTNTAVPTATHTPSTSNTPAAKSTSAANPTAPGGAIASDDPSPVSRVGGVARVPAGITLPSTGSGGLR